MLTFGNLLENSAKLTVSLLFMVDCQVLISILFDPQGDALQKGTEVSIYVVLRFASSEECSCSVP